MSDIIDSMVIPEKHDFLQVLHGVMNTALYNSTFDKYRITGEQT